MPLDAEMQAAVAAGQTVVRETTIGTAPVRLMAAAVPTPGGTLTALVFADRTAELDTLRTLVVVLLGGGVAVLAASVVVGYVYAGRALVPIRESLRRQREFTADASHELRTPLSITRAAIGELRRGRGDPATVDRAIDDLDAGAARMEILVDDLLLLARTDADAVTLAVEDTDLALAAAEATEALEPVAATRGIRLVLDIEPTPVRGDEARLRQLAGILVDNAIRHSPDGGRVTVTVRPGARLIVDDEGDGIATEDLDKVFDRFWRAPGAPAGGTGLGLAIASWIAQHHGGDVHAANRDPGPGARFTVNLPGNVR
jgi:signal transduction histidine kinase